MRVLIGIILWVLVFINLAIFHKFVATYHSNFVGGCAMEIFWAAIATAIEVAVFRGIILKIFGMLASVLGFVGKLLLIVVVISIVIYAVWKIVQIVKSKLDMDKDNGSYMNFTKGTQDMFAKNVPNMEMIPCAKCGKTINRNSKFCKFCGSKLEEKSEINSL